MKAGIPQDKTAFGINQVCGSGLRAVALAMLHVGSGDAEIIVDGGQESISLSPHVAHMHARTKMGEMKLIDSMIKDGLWDASPRLSHGHNRRERCASSRSAAKKQDVLAIAS
jgi:acetyl-CoA C-acetyltransferase